MFSHPFLWNVFYNLLIPYSINQSKSGFVFFFVIACPLLLHRSRLFCKLAALVSWASWVSALQVILAGQRWCIRQRNVSLTGLRFVKAVLLLGRGVRLQISPIWREEIQHSSAKTHRNLIGWISLEWPGWRWYYRRSGTPFLVPESRISPIDNHDDNRKRHYYSAKTHSIQNICKGVIQVDACTQCKVRIYIASRVQIERCVQQNHSNVALNVAMTCG